jgi:hypothetical protein
MTGNSRLTEERTGKFHRLVEDKRGRFLGRVFVRRGRVYWQKSVDAVDQEAVSALQALLAQEHP